MAFNIGLSKKESRIAHWKDIQSRVTTHEGELLNKEKGLNYRKKYAENYLGIKWKPTDFSKPEYQKELEKEK